MIVNSKLLSTGPILGPRRSLVQCNRAHPTDPLTRLFLSITRRKEDTKRQRTGSDSSSLPSDSKTLLPNVDSDEGDQSTKAPAVSHKKMRGAAARNHRDKEIRDREEKRERERADAAGRRKGRAERRRGDGTSSTLSR